MAQNVILENRTKRPPRMLVLNLDVTISSVRLETRSIVEGSDGKSRVKVSTKSVPDSLRIPAGGESLPLPEKILKCESVKAAIAARDIRVKYESEPKKIVSKPKPSKASNSKSEK